MPNKKKVSMKPIASRPKSKQRQVAVVSLPYNSPMKPIPRFVSLRPVIPGACVAYSGCDYIGSVSSSASANSTGALSSLAAFSSSGFPRLFSIADLFLRFHWRKLRYHFIGKSASTQAGTGAFCAFVLDASTTSIVVNTETIVKNAEGALVLKGWESGSLDVNVDAAGTRWYNNDADTILSAVGAVCQFIPQTTNAADLSWDQYVEYEVEFAEPVAGATISPLTKERRDKKLQEFLSNMGKPRVEIPDIEDLDKEITKLRKKLCDLECRKTSSA